VARALRRAGCALIACLALLAVASPAAMARTMTFKIGPFEIKPGQNEIDNTLIVDKPKIDGYITRIRPDLIYTNGRVPPVDVIHLHHGVWLNLGRRDATAPFLPERVVAAGEEKTIMQLPEGYGYPYRASQPWALNSMLHNLTPTPARVYMVWEIDFVPASAPAARSIRPVRPIWMDVFNGSGYPVFNVRKGAGRGGTYTFPRDARDPYGGGPRRNEWVVDRGGVLVATAGHLHPGGLHTDLYVRRRGARIEPARCGTKPRVAARRRCRLNAPRGRAGTAHLFRSVAKYYEPAGAVSWDVSMTGTPADWRVKVRRGDVLRTSATYDSSRAAWWESMGIMVVYMADGGPARDPFRRRVIFPGRVTHGHLPENDNHGGRPARMPDARRLPDGPENPGTVDILDFRYRLGDLSLSGGGAGRPPVIRPGQTLLFRNGDDAERVYHSISSCRPPCNRTTGIAYPLADGDVQFESGTLGSADPPATGALEWRTPDDLRPGTYTYFCRIHPFMRGAFRVKK
jgi:hypothetical protein